MLTAHDFWSQFFNFKNSNIVFDLAEIVHIHHLFVQTAPLVSDSPMFLIITKCNKSIWTGSKCSF